MENMHECIICRQKVQRDNCIINELSGMKRMSRIKAAIIDDGVDVSQFSNIQSFTVKKDLSIKKDFTAAKQYNHATTCMKIIQKFTDISNVDWYSIKY